MSYRFKTGDVIGLEAETVSASKRVRRSDEAQTSFTLPIFPAYFRSGSSQTTLMAVWQNYDKIHGLADNPDEAEVTEAAGGVDSDALLDEGLLWGQVEDAGNVTEERFVATRSLVKTVCHVVSISY